MFQMLVLANGQRYLLRVPAGAGLGVAPAWPSAAVAVAVLAPPGAGRRTPKLNARLPPTERGDRRAGQKRPARSTTRTRAGRGHGTGAGDRCIVPCRRCDRMVRTRRQRRATPIDQAMNARASCQTTRIRRPGRGHVVSVGCACGSSMPESPRAMDLREQHRQPGRLRYSESRGFANPPRSGSAFCDGAEPTPTASSDSRGQPCRYRVVAALPKTLPGLARTRICISNAATTMLSDLEPMLTLVIAAGGATT